jgi:hypothetical protein
MKYTMVIVVMVCKKNCISFHKIQNISFEIEILL